MVVWHSQNCRYPHSGGPHVVMEEVMPYTNLCCPKCWTLETKSGTPGPDRCQTCQELRLNNVCIHHNETAVEVTFLNEARKARQALGLAVPDEAPKWLTV